MPKATITLPDGTLVTIDGNPEEISRILRLYSAREGKPATRQPVGEAPLETISARVQEGAAAKDRPRRRVPIVWWLVPILLAVLVLGWIVLYGKLNSVSKTLDQAVTMQAATETARFGLEPSLPRSTPTSLAGCSATKSCTYPCAAIQRLM